MISDKKGPAVCGYNQSLSALVHLNESEQLVQTLTCQHWVLNQKWGLFKGKRSYLMTFWLKPSRSSKVTVGVRAAKDHGKKFRGELAASFSEIVHWTQFGKENISYPPFLQHFRREKNEKKSRSIADRLLDSSKKLSVIWSNPLWGGGEGALIYEAIRDVPFFRVSFFSLNSWTGYKNWPKIPWRVMTICWRTIGYCIPIAFLLFCNLKIPKQGIEMEIFSWTGCRDS